ncbi:CHAT domain-containing protein, partial [bacterium]|nr:CHAT domain-containing protein [bacterium]
MGIRRLVRGRSTGRAVAVAAAGVAVCLAAAHPAPGLDRAGVLALADSLHAAAALDSAQSLLAAAIPDARAAADSAHLQELMVRRGAQLAAFGRYAAAEPELREALALCEARRDTVATCQVLRWLALSISNQGRLDEAEPLTRRQLALATAAGATSLVAWARVAQGWYASEQGRPRRAAAEYRAAIDAFGELGDGRGEAWTRNNLGIALAQAGDLAGAQAAYEAAAARARDVGHAMVEAMAVNNLGTLAYSWGDPGRAEAAFRRAHDLLFDLGHTAEATRTGLNVATCLMALGRLPEAAVQLDSLCRTAAAQSDAPLRAETLITLGHLRQQQGRTDEARSLWRDVIGEPLDIDVNTRIVATVALARALADEDRLVAGLALLEQGRDLVRDRVGSVRWAGFESLRGDLLVRLGRREEGVPLLRRVVAETSAEGENTLRVEALEALARAYRSLMPDSSRAILVRAMDAWERARGVPREPEWREARAEAGDRIHTDWARQEIAAGATVAHVFDRLQRYKARTLLERMHGPGEGPVATRSGRPDGLVSLDSLRSILDDREVLLDTYLGPEGSVAFVVTRDRCRTILWPGAATIRRRAAFFRELHLVPTVDVVPAAETTAVARAGRALGTWLLGELASDLAGADRLVVCPDGPLNLLPWSSLSVTGGTDGGIDLATRELVVVPSASILARLRVRRTSAMATAAHRPAVVALTGGEGDRLPAARDEVAWLARAFGGVVTLADPAAADPAAWPAGDILHVAAHARPHDDAPWQSAILLGRARLTAARVAALDLDARVAVLAGCETAGGRVLTGEGIQGLSAAFLSSGVPVVVATLWPVDDRT